MFTKLSSFDPDFEANLQAILRWDASEDAAIETQVKAIIQAVRTEGDSAVRRFTASFDHLDTTQVQNLIITQDELKAAFDSLDQETRAALETAASRIKTFHQKQWQHNQGFEFQDEYGSTLGQLVRPLERVGIYVPGGKAAYPSSVLMNAIPARVAGVGEIIMVVPTPHGVKNTSVLAAAFLAEVDTVFTIGGAQAVAALAYGTASIPRVDKIVGPGNAYVAAAKRQVFGQVGIDMIAGPSEILVLADGSVPAHWIAMDLFAQAEHDEMAQSILIATDESYLDAVLHAIELALPQQSRAKIIEQSLRNRGAMICVRDMDEACMVANFIAPEHLEIATQDAAKWVTKIQHAGAVFVGAYSSEALGDYCAGPNHVLPTSGTARFSSPLGVYDFQKRMSLMQISENGAQHLGKLARTLGQLEGLPAHAQSAYLRVMS